MIWLYIENSVCRIRLVLLMCVLFIFNLYENDGYFEFNVS